MTVVGLVHGGWHGAWCWDLLAAELTARGHAPVAMDLPAGDPAAGAGRYAAAVTAALAAATGQDMPADPDTAAAAGPLAGGSATEPVGRDLVLVAHSLAGLAAPLVPGVRQVVYVAAMLPEPGVGVDDRARAGERMTRRGLGRGQRARPDGATEWDPAAAVEWLYPDSPPDRAAASAARLRPQHWRITAEPSPTAGPGRGAYVLCRDDRVIDTDWARAAADRHGLELVELPGDHSPFLSRPTALADLLERWL